MTQQSQFLTTIDCDEAHRLFRSHLDLQPVGTEMVQLPDLLGRVFSQTVVAPNNVPGFDRSNFDGFAIRSSDVVGASELKPAALQLLPEKIPAGRQPDFSIAPGQAVAISTGGMVPRGANAVCLIENTEVVPSDGESKILVSRSVFAGSGISFAGTDIACGETVARPGQRISSRETGVLAAIGLTEAEVYRRPKVAVISTGDEIIPPGNKILPGQVFDSNARIIADAIKEAGGDPLELGIAVDELNELERRVEQALTQADMVLLSGGTSKGEGDLSYRVVSKFDDPGIIAHGVALKPGKPICLAATKNKPLVVLPGFPTSAIFTFHEFIVPIIRIMSGHWQVDQESPVSASLATRVNSEIGRTEFLLVGLFNSLPAAESGSANQSTKTLKAYPMGKGSGSVTTFSRADGFITIDRHTELLDEGQRVNVQLIGEQTRAADLVVMGSHCQKLDLILDELQQQGIRVKYFAIGSTAGLRAAKQGDCDIAGIHLLDPETGRYNEPFSDDNIVIHKGYSRTQGLVYRESDRRWEPLRQLSPEKLMHHITSLESMMMINRNQGSGTRILIDWLLRSASHPQPNGYEIQASNHHAVCAAVKQQRSDWGMAISDVARANKLGFIPIGNEEFDFAIPKSRLDLSPVQSFLKILNRFTQNG